MMLQFYYISKKQNDDLRGMATRRLYVVRHRKMAGEGESVVSMQLVNKLPFIF